MKTTHDTYGDTRSLSARKIAPAPTAPPRVYSQSDASRLGLKSRTAWARAKRIVPPEVAPVGYVVGETEKVQGLLGGQIVVEDLGRDRFLVATQNSRVNYAVFAEEQTAPKAVRIPRKARPLKAASVWNPAGFLPQDHLPVEMHAHADHARYLLHRICYAQIFFRRGKGPVPLMAKLLRRFIPKTVYTGLRDALIDSEAITCDGKAQTGKKSYHFDVGPALSCRRFERVDITHQKLAKKILAYREAKEREITEDVHRHLRDNLHQVEIDADAARASIRRKNGRRGVCLAASVEAISAEDFWFTVCPYGRVHTNLTNLHSSLRKFLRVGGDTLVNLDLRNSQPLFLGMLAMNYFLSASSLTAFSAFEVQDTHLFGDISDRILDNLSLISRAYNLTSESKASRDQALPPCTPSHYDVPFQASIYLKANPNNQQAKDHEKGNKQHPNHASSHYDVHSVTSFQKESTVKLLGLDLPEDFLLYLDLCQTGQFYEFLMRQHQVDAQGRPQFKRRLYRRLFFGKDKDTPEGKVFAQHFPNVYHVIRFVKGKDYRRLAHALQRLEAHFVIHRVVSRLMVESPDWFIATIHDSCVTTVEHAEGVLRVVRDEFSKVGLDPTIKMEVLR